MYENVHDILLKQKLIKIIEENISVDEKLLKVLFEELENPKLSHEGEPIFCVCGYPVQFKTKDEIIWIEPLLKTEVEFDSFKEYFYCPKCGKLLKEIQY